jgi:ubiquinone biosynthesis protein COQ9
MDAGWTIATLGVLFYRYRFNVVGVYACPVFAFMVDDKSARYRSAKQFIRESVNPHVFTVYYD